MNPKSRLVVIVVLLILLGVPWRSAAADVGPKPSMDFSFTQAVAGEKLTITGGEMFECDQPDCSDAKPLAKLGPQRFTCTASGCAAMAYGFSDYHRLEVQFSDGKTRQSNVFKTGSFNGSYKVTIREADLLVESQFTLDPFSGTTYIILCACCLLLVAVIVVIVALIVRRTRKK